MFINSLLYNIKTFEVLDTNGSATHLEVEDMKESLFSYSEIVLKEGKGDLIVITPLLLRAGKESEVIEINDLTPFGFSAATVEDLGIEGLKPLSKDKFIFPNTVEDNINVEELADGLEKDLGEAFKDISSISGGAKYLEQDIKKAANNGEGILEYLRQYLKIFAMTQDNPVSNKYTKLMTSIKSKIDKLVEANKDKKTTILKKIANFVLAIGLQVCRALLGVLKFTTDLVICLAKFTGYTILTITKNIGLLAVNIVAAFKTDLLNIYRKPVVA